MARGHAPGGVLASVATREAVARAPAHAGHRSSPRGGELSSEAVGLLVDAREAAPEEFTEAESMLVDAAIALPARELRTAIAYWRQMADAAGAADREQRQVEGRRLHVSPQLSGMVRVDGDLDPSRARR